MRFKQILIIITFSTLGMSSCNNLSQNSKNENKTSVTDKKPIVIQPKKNNDSIALPLDSIYTVKILTVGIFHNNEVSNNDKNQQWLGLFKNKKGFYLKRTKIRTEKINDLTLDTEEEKTGWEVSTIIKDTCMILIEPLPFLKERKIKKFKLAKDTIFPNDTLQFKYLGIDYNLFATGNKEIVNEGLKQVEIWNYKLYLVAEIKGQKRTSLLVNQGNFNYDMIQIIFAGDIDGDGILDLIINTPRYYYERSPTLYLSRPANNEEVVKRIGAHTTVGA